MNPARAVDATAVVGKAAQQFAVALEVGAFGGGDRFAGPYSRADATDIRGDGGFFENTQLVVWRAA